MDENVKKRNECLAQTVIKGLQSRNMSGYYAANREEALKLALELIPEGSTIAMGGCMSAHEIGLIKALEEGNYNYIDRAKLDPRAGLMAAYDADVFLSSANAITDDGIMVNIDGNSNRVSCIAQGPKKVIFIVGINKVCSETTSIINTALDLNEQKDFLKAKSQCEKLRKIWSKRYPYLSAMIDHSQLDGASAAIKATKDISKDNEDELSEKLIEAKDEIQLLKENQSITLGNIF